MYDSRGHRILQPYLLGLCPKEILCPGGARSLGAKRKGGDLGGCRSPPWQFAGAAGQETRSARTTSLWSYSRMEELNQPVQVINVRTSSLVGPMMASTGAAPASYESTWVTW